MKLGLEIIDNHDLQTDLNRKGVFTGNFKSRQCVISGVCRRRNFKGSCFHDLPMISLLGSVSRKAKEKYLEAILLK